MFAMHTKVVEEAAAFQYRNFFSVHPQRRLMLSIDDVLPSRLCNRIELKGKKMKIRKEIHSQ